jgi:amino acid adenylation domain-containing protein
MQKENIQAIYPLSPLQEGLFFHSLNNKNSAAYFIQVAYRISGHMDPIDVQQSLNILAERYEILRTSFVLEGLKKTFQVVLKERPPEFYYEDIRNCDNKDAYLEEMRQKDKQRSFDLTRDPLMRVLMYRLEDNVYDFIWSHHHIIMDGWCTGIILSEFQHIYNCLQKGISHQLPPVVQYSQFIKWIEKRDAKSAASFWKQYLDGYESRTSIGLPDVKQAKGYDNCEVLLSIPNETYVQVVQLCAKWKVTLNSFLQAVWGLLLSRYTGKNDVVFGMVVSLRPAEIKGVESIVGLLINTVPVRIRMNLEESFSLMVQQVQRQAMLAERHQHFPLADIQASSTLRQNLLDHVFVAGNEQMEGMEKLPQQEMQISNVRSQAQVNYDFSIYVSAGDGIRVRFNYNGFVYSKTYIEQVAAHYDAILSEVIASPDVLTQNIRMLSEAEQEQLINIGKGADRHYPGTIDSLFRDRALQQPNAVAVADNNKTLTYEELDKNASALAVAIQDAGIEKGSYIGVKIGRSVDTVISFLGIAKAGCVYVPIDPDHPNERVVNMLSAAPLKMLITTSEYLFDLPETGAMVFVIDLQLNPCIANAGEYSGSEATDTAYVIFTSGTTGQPKGIPVRHESIVDRSLYHIEYLGLNNSDAIMQLASVAFDASVIEMCMTLLAGGRLCIPSPQAKQDPLLLSEYIVRNNITTGIFPPAYLKLFSTTGLTCLKQIISTGEAAILKDMLAHAEKRRVHNGYGPTELCIGASFHTVDKSREESYLAAGNVPIGRPFSNTHVYVLDSYGRLCPSGVAGELCAAGVGVTNGYLGEGPSASEKFITNPYCNTPGFDRLYRTGDLVRWNVQNELVYHGRIDEQVQVRGIRVELREIEAIIFKYPGINQACVQAYVHDGNTYLVAYITAHNTIETEELFVHLRSRLPEYMVPSQISVLDVMPLTSSGKIDRRQLPPFDFSIAEAYEAPQNETEALLCRIWQDILERERIGRQDNFFAIGGHSLKATQIVSAVYKHLGIRLDIGEIFSHPRIALLAPLLASQQKTPYTAIKKIHADDYPVTPSQRRLWVLHQLGGAATAYNISGSYQLSGDVNADAIKSAFHEIIKKHDSLRTCFVLQGEALRQVIKPVEKAVDMFEYLHVDKDEIPALVAQLNAYEFDLEQGCLMRVKLLQYGRQEFVLACVMHHIISDGWSVRSMLHELSSVYNNAYLSPLKIQYTDYANWLVQELNNEQLSKARKYWLSELKGRIEPLQLVTDYSRPAVQTFNGSTESILAGPELLQRIKTFAKEHQTSVFTILLSAVKLLLFRYTNQNNITVGTAVSGREHPDVHELIGCFINTIVLSTDLTDDMKVKELISQVKRKTVDGYANQLYPFDQLVEEVEADRDLSRSALFDVLVNHQSLDASDEQVNFNGLSLHKYDNGVDTVSSKFDLEFDFYEHTNELAIHVIYNTDLFKQKTIAAYCRQLLLVLQEMIDHSSKELSQVLLTDETAVFDSYSKGPVRNYDTTAGYSVLFGMQVLESGDQIAVEDATTKLSYSVLNDASDKVAAKLYQKFAAFDGSKKLIVAVCIERSCNLVALAIGIWKAGGIYMPVDPLLPADPMKYILEDAGASLLITDNFVDEISIPQGLPSDFLSNDHSGRPTPVRASRENDGSYLLYTSGSTGRPKGVIVSAQGMLNHMHSKREDLSLNSQSIVAQTATQGFDVSIWQTFAALLCGGKVNVYSRQQVLELRTQLSDLQLHGVTVMQMVPSYLNEFLEELEKCEAAVNLPSLKYLVTAGEELSAALAARWFRLVPHAHIANCYGPTEASDNISIHIMQTSDGRERIPVGRPLANTQLYVVDAKGRLCMKGIVGEIWVSGPGVANGYIGKESIHSNKVFMEDPFTPSRWLYRTGDLGRWNDEGVLEFHGRADRQVKLRGQRVELGEVERVIQSFADIKQCAVVFEADEPGGSLSAYVSWKENSKPEERIRALRAYLSASMASFMVPRHIVELEVLPLTPSGKIDRKKLPKQTAAKKKLLLPVNVAEERLLAIWREVLKKEEVSVEDNFFELGGHSLKAMRLLAAIEQIQGTRLKLQEVFKYPTIRTQARLLDTIDWIQQSKDVNVPVNEEEESVII